MIISIDEELFQEVKRIVKGRSLSIYKQLEEIKPLETTADATLIKAREVKTQNIKQSIKETIKSLYNQNIIPNKYKIHKATGIAYVTLNKYYDEILKEVTNGNEH